MPPGATFQLDVADLSVQYGKYASRFPRVPLPLEAALCQRYYPKSYHFDTAPGTSGSASAVRVQEDAPSGTATVVGVNTRFAVEMLPSTTPTVTWYALTGTVNSCTNNGVTDTILNQAVQSARTTGTFDVTTTGTARTIIAHYTAVAEL